MKPIEISPLIRVLAVATAMSGLAWAAAQTDPADKTYDGGGVPYRETETIPPGNPPKVPGSPTTIPENPNAIPENPDERGWRQTQEESDAMKDAQKAKDKRKADPKKKTKDKVEREDWRDAVGEMTAGDREITRQTRQAVVADKTLSTSAHNVKIISRNGKVTLKGRVLSDVERNSIVEKAAAVVGAENVVDKLTVKPPKFK